LFKPTALIALFALVSGWMVGLLSGNSTQPGCGLFYC